MAYVPGFEYDVFISYAWVDNQSDDDAHPELGWITQFRERLLNRVDQKLGRMGSAAPFFDTFAIRKNRDFGSQIEAALSKTAVFVAVFSPGYIKSKACCEEIRFFNQVVNSKLSQSGRLFLVRLDDVPKSKWPVGFTEYIGHELLGYPFYASTEGSHDTYPLPPTDDRYLKELNLLRCAVARQLETMKEAADQDGNSSNANAASTPAAVLAPTTPAAASFVLRRTPSSEARPTILLAQSTPDLRGKRTKLIEYCQSAEIEVLGQKPYPSEFADAFQADLARSQLFVQLLSATYSDSTEDFPNGIEQWQLSTARARNMAVLQWRDANTDLSELEEGHHHRLLLEDPDVRRDVPANFHQEVVQKARLNFKLSAAPPPQQQKRFAILKYNDTDRGETTELLKELRRNNVACLSSNNGLPLVESVRETKAQALIIVLGQCPNDWAVQRGIELFKVESTFRDQKPLRLYYRSETSEIVPPLNDPEVLEFRGRPQLPALIEAIHSFGGAS